MSRPERAQAQAREKSGPHFQSIPSQRRSTGAVNRENAVSPTVITPITTCPRRSRKFPSRSNVENFYRPERPEQIDFQASCLHAVLALSACFVAICVRFQCLSPCKSFTHKRGRQWTARPKFRNCSKPFPV